MCTATWLRCPGTFHLLHNRDELRTRLPALPPHCHNRNGVRILAPIDADAGGTWIGVNEFKLAACLLNRYDPIAYAGPFTSRGQLILHALTGSTINNACMHIVSLDLNTFQPFTLVFLQSDVSVQVLDWNGTTLNHTQDADSRLPLVSSSYDQTAASQIRKVAFAALPTPHSVQDLQEYHASHGASGPDALSVCMSRADARTVSFTHIEVSPSTIKLTYHPAAPCEPANDISLFLN